MDVQNSIKGYSNINSIYEQLSQIAIYRPKTVALCRDLDILSICYGALWRSRYFLPTNPSITNESSNTIKFGEPFQITSPSAVMVLTLLNFIQERTFCLRDPNIIKPWVP